MTSHTILACILWFYITPALLCMAINVIDWETLYDSATIACNGNRKRALNMLYFLTLFPVVNIFNLGILVYIFIRHNFR